jgi:homoserine kinase
VRARAPASSANLGPGFDTLAVAVDRYVSVEVEPADSLRVRTEGEGAGLFDDASHLAARVVAEVLGHERFSVTIRSEIPLARGLGSSAALAAAAAAAAGADDPFAVAAAYDGHPENAAASVFGGLVAATSVDGVPVRAALPLAEALELVAIVPDRNLATPEARGVLPDRLSREDAVFNLGRMGLLMAGLADPAALRPAATEDRIHQPARTVLFPEAPALLAALVEAGAHAACWSGAGPTLIGFVSPEDVEAVRAGAGAALEAAGIEGRVLSLRVDRRGLVYGDEAVVALEGPA